MNEEKEIRVNENLSEGILLNEQQPENIHEEQITECLNCGAKLELDQEFCTKCGMKKGTKKEIVCQKCGEVVNLGQKFCPKCGEKVEINLDNIVNSAKKQYNEKIKKVGSKKIKIIIIIFLILIAIGFIVSKIAPKIFISTEEILATGDYQQAYEKEKDINKKYQIAQENLIAVLCNEIIDSYKDPSSFELRDAWIDEETVVIKAGGKNSYGGVVFSYSYYTYDEDDKEYQLYCSLSSLEKEEYYSFDDYEDKIEKMLKNVARSVVSELIRKDDKQLNNESIKNINNLFKNDLLDSVKILENINLLMEGNTEGA